MPVPSDFDMRRPSGASTVEWMITSLERDLAHQLEPGEDHPVLPEADDVARRRVEVARIEVRAGPGVSSGQPSVANGQSADENHVSSTSVSRVSSPEPHSAHAAGSVSSTVRCPSGQYQTGIWWPHQICREMFQSGAFSSESIAKRVLALGMEEHARDSGAPRAAAA